MKKVKLLSMPKQHNKGQSFMEMALILGVLLLLLLGMIEFGNLLNQYINLVDGAREGARFGSNNDPFFDPVTKQDDYTHVQDTFYEDIDKIVEGLQTYDQAGAIAPILLNPDNPNHDDVVISVISIRTNGIYIIEGTKSMHQDNHASKILADQGFITNSLNGNAPNTGILVVEIFYAYNQILGLPIFTVVIPNPIEVHAYAIMPLSAAEPTPDIPAH
jgi:hypothetical protein